MLRPKKKITKREIKQDQFVTRAMQFEAWALENKKLLSYAGIALVALVAAVFIWRDRSTAAEVEAATRLAAIVPVYDQGSYQEALDGVPSQGKFGLRAIVEEYGGTDAGQLARFYCATALESTGKYAEAATMYEDVSVDDRLVTSAALSGAGSCFEALGRHEEAARTYERSASADPKNPLAPERLLRAGVNYGQAGQSSDAKNAFTTLKRQYPTSTAARDIDRYEAQFAS